MPTDDPNAKSNGAVEGVEGDEALDEDQKPAAKRSAKHDSGAADLERVTDFAEEHEFSSQDINRVREQESTFLLENVRLTTCLCEMIVVGHDVDW